MIPLERQLLKKLSLHKAEECSGRMVGCPNRQFGCKEIVSVAKIHQHIHVQCIYEKFKDELIKRSKQRREMVKCSGCGKFQMFMKLKEHEIQECENRKVPCRNWHLGCTVQVRERDRAIHEDATLDNTMRSCIYFGGGAARMEIGLNISTVLFYNKLL